MAIPQSGIWKSGNGLPPVTVTKVAEFTDAEGYFLATVEIEGDPDIMELDPEEWDMFIKANALTPA